MTLIIGAIISPFGFYPRNRVLMDFLAARQVESYRSCKQLLRPVRQPPLPPPPPRVKRYYHSAKLTRTKDSSVSRRYRGGDRATLTVGQHHSWLAEQ